jgi:hypothetical protein
VTPGAAQTQPGGGTCGITGTYPGVISGPCTDVYLGKVDAAGSLVYATYLGGPTADQAKAIAIDPAGNVYVMRVTANDRP